jgi:outer membrane protein assembly factor BamB
MQKLKNKTAAIAIVLMLMLTMSASLVLLPNVKAHDPGWKNPSWAYLVASPNPVGVGQPVEIVMWIDTPMPSSAVGNDIRRHDYTLAITDPNGAVETQHWDIVSDPTSIQYIIYTPDQIGNYTLKFSYGGQTYTWSGTNQNDTYAPASKTITLTVQQEPIPAARTSYPLPTEYWTRPIEGQNSDWYAISSNWLRAPYIAGGSGVSGAVQLDGIAPNSAHVMWAKPLQDGGIVGGTDVGVNGNSYYMGGSYNIRFSAPIVMYGRLYYAEPYGNSGGGGDYVCVDIRTGDEIWRINTTIGGVPSFGYLYDWEDGNQHGVLPEGLLFTNSYARAYDPSNGVLTNMNITNVPSGTESVGPKGEILRYSVANVGTTANPNWRLTQWNSSKLLGAGLGPSGWYTGGFINASLSTRYDWNISLTLPNSGSWSINRLAYNKMMLLTQGSLGSRGSWDGENITAIGLNTDPDTYNLGRTLWTKYYPAAPGNVSRSIVAWDPDVGVFCCEDTQTMVHYGFSLTDGSQIWGPTHPAPDFNYFRSTTLTAYGKMYYGGYGGILFCYDLKSGSLLWTYGNGGEGNSTNSGLETPWGLRPNFIDVIADGKVYLATTEHSPGSPLYKDSLYRCINATDGTEIWTLMGWGTGMDANYDVVADGFFVFLNCYDMRVYSVGKGPSAMTLEAPMNSLDFGKSVVIRGKVTDVSAGTKQSEQVARFPNGVPAVSDESMGRWMEYVYMQKPKPTNTSGVPVSIDVVDANGNYRNIGKTKSDSSGMFSYTWKPDIEGTYYVVANFAGSESYWPSQAESSFVVDPTAPTASPYPVTVLPPTEMYIAAGVVAIIVAIAIGFAITILMIRKRP